MAVRAHLGGASAALGWGFVSRSISGCLGRWWRGSLRQCRSEAAGPRRARARRRLWRGRTGNGGGFARLGLGLRFICLGVFEAKQKSPWGGRFGPGRLDGEVASPCVAVGGVAHEGMPGARVARVRSQGGAVFVNQWACGVDCPGARRVGWPGGWRRRTDEP